MGRPDIPSRIKQIHHAYLDVEFKVDYYIFIRDRTSRYAKHLDFAIGLGALASGGTGLGILGEPMFAWLCGILTTISVTVAVAKSNYDWNGRISKWTELLEHFRDIASQYKNLIDDLNYHHNLSPEYESLHLKLRAEFINAPKDPYPVLSKKLSEVIQQGVAERIDRKDWWLG